MLISVGIRSILLIYIVEFNCSPICLTLLTVLIDTICFLSLFTLYQICNNSKSIFFLLKNQLEYWFTHRIGNIAWYFSHQIYLISIWTFHLFYIIHILIIIQYTVNKVPIVLLYYYYSAIAIIIIIMFLRIAISLIYVWQHSVTLLICDSPKTYCT